ncbi:MAG: hypothetical protein ACYDIA_22685 [Candidatus Humimicrobiaceae bacterium]
MMIFELRSSWNVDFIKRKPYVVFKIRCPNLGYTYGTVIRMDEENCRLD